MYKAVRNKNKKNLKHIKVFVQESSDYHNQLIVPSYIGLAS